MSERFPRAVAGVILGVGAYHLLAAGTVGLGIDESYYYVCARHVEMSYFDHPPLSMWLAAGSMGLLGPHAWALRLPTILMFAGTTALLYATGSRLFGRGAGLWAAVLLNLCGMFVLVHGMMLLPDGALLFFSALSVYLLSRVLFDPAPRWAAATWAMAGLAAGLAMLSKYQGAFIPVMTAAFLAVRRDQRRQLRTPGPYLAAAIAAACLAPVIVWNAQHGWASFVFHGSRVGSPHGLQFGRFVANVLGQAGYVLPWLWVPLIWQMVAGLRGRDGRRLFFSLLAAGPIVTITAVSLISRTVMLPHWQGMGYLMLFVPLGAATAGWLKAGSRLARRWLIGSTVLSVAAVAAVSLHATLDVFRYVVPERLWQRMAKGADLTTGIADYDELPKRLEELGLAGKGRVFVFGVRWSTAAKAEWALRSQMPVLCLSATVPHEFAFIRDSRDYLGWDGVLVEEIGDRHGGAPPSQSRISRQMGAYFERITPLGAIPVRLGGFVEGELVLFHCQNYRTPVPSPYR